MLHTVGHVSRQEPSIGIGQIVIDAIPTRNRPVILQCVDVVVAVAVPFGLTQPYAVDDGGMVQGVADDGILLVEWGDPVAASLGDHLHVALAHDTEFADESDPDGMPPSSRTITVTGVGRAWAPRWDRLCTALEALSC